MITLIFDAPSEDESEDGIKRRHLMDEHCALSAIVAQNPFIFDGAHSSVSLKPFDCVYTPLRPEGQASPHDNSVHFPPPRIQQEALTDTSDCSALFSSESSFAVPRDERNSGAKIVTWRDSIPPLLNRIVDNVESLRNNYMSNSLKLLILPPQLLLKSLLLPYPHIDKTVLQRYENLLRLQMPWLVSAQDLLLEYQISAFYGKAWIPSPTTTVSLVLSRLGEQAMKSMHFWLDA